MTILWHDHSVTMIVRWIVVLGASCAAGLIDLRTRRIPNLLTYPVLLVGYGAATIGGGLAGFVDAVAASVLLSAPYVLLFAFAGGGAGDVKIMAALGSWLGVLNGTIVLFSVAATGAVLAAGILIMRAFRQRPVERVEACSAAKAIEMPYGVAVWAGVWVAAAGVWAWTW